MGNDTYEKRQRERVALAATKAKEKEMKEEKKAEQLVRTSSTVEMMMARGRKNGVLTADIGENHQAQGQARCKGREGEI